jgi:hypothetical protein
MKLRTLLYNMLQIKLQLMKMQTNQKKGSTEELSNGTYDAGDGVRVR